jgi:hypothetical protein
VNAVEGFFLGLLLSLPMYWYVLDPVFAYIERPGRGRR